MRARSAVGLLAAGAALAGAIVFVRTKSAVEREHVDVYFADGSMVSLEPGSPTVTGFSHSPAARSRRREDDGRRARRPAPRARPPRGDFVLRSGRRSTYYLDKYRFETRPDLLRELGKRIAERVRVRARGEASGRPRARRRRARRGRLARGEPPFLIVRKEAKEYGTEKRIEGEFASGEEVCLVEDIVTTGGASEQAVEALREAGLVCRTAVCVVDREEGGADALARKAVRLVPIFRASELVSA